jgi:hypothetical protein
MHIASPQHMRITEDNIVACLLKAEIVKPAGTAVARERLCEHIVKLTTIQVTKLPL